MQVPVEFTDWMMGGKFTLGTSTAFRVSYASPNLLVASAVVACFAPLCQMV